MVDQLHKIVGIRQCAHDLTLLLSVKEYNTTTENISLTNKPFPGLVFVVGTQDKVSLLLSYTLPHRFADSSIQTATLYHDTVV